MRRIPALSALAVLLVVEGPLRAGAPVLPPIAPSVEGIRGCRVFAEPLLPVGGRPTEADCRELAAALEACRQTGSAFRVAPLLDYLKAHGDSPWKASLLANLGIAYRQTGFFSRALACLEGAWELARDQRGYEAQDVAELAVGHLAELQVRLGRREPVAALVAQLKGRPFHGSAADRVEAARAGLAFMEQHPDRGYRCGPVALAGLMAALKPGTLEDPRLEAYPSTPRGTSLAQMGELGRTLGADLVPARRIPGAPVAVPSLVHWKSGHFAALVARRGEAFLVRDSVLGGESWVSAAALDEEGSGYALVPSRALSGEGWNRISESEAAQVWGSGYTEGPDDRDPGSDKRPKNCDGGGSTGMPRYSMAANLVSLQLRDTPVGYRPPLGPALEFELAYNQRDIAQPQTFSFGNLGRRWTHNWTSYVYFTPTGASLTPSVRYPSASADPSGSSRAVQAQDAKARRRVEGQEAETLGYDIWIYERGGGIYQAGGYNYAKAPQVNNPTGGKLLVVSATRCERRYPDGSLDVFSHPVGSSLNARVFLTEMRDPAGNTTTLGYDTQTRLVTITDALGQVTHLSYDLAADPLKLTQVTDPFGRTAQFQYNGEGQLVAITDAAGMTSRFAYGPTTANPGLSADFINAMTTPYGTTTFDAGLNGSDRWLEATDPMGQRERMEYRNNSSVPYQEPAAPAGFDNVYLNYRNTFFWDKGAMALYPGDYAKAEIIHWLHRSGSGLTSSLKESTKRPLESRVWYRYGQTGPTYVEGPSGQPTSVARIGDGNETQRTDYEYNDFAKVTLKRDPAGRATAYAYSADGLDLLEVRNRTAGRDERMATYTYNAQHRPLTAVDAAGQTTTFTYNGRGQLATVTNAKGETTTLNYDGQGYLKEVVGPLPGAKTIFTYDTAGRVASVTGADGLATAFEYDALDRRTKVIHADGTYEETVYDRLDAARTRDRGARWTLMTYNALRQLEEVQDPEGRITRLGWCGCGALERLTDPNGRVTLWVRDLQGRVVSKVYDDLSKSDYTYDAIGRLSQRIDAKKQVTTYAYFTDDNLKGVAYANAQRPTPSVSYTYDPAYNRLASMTDGTGTTTYEYHPMGIGAGLGAGRLATVTSPMANSTIAYGYDELGRVTTRSINGVAETRAFDGLGRLAGVTNPLGAFAFAYDGASGRLGNVAYPNGQNTQFTYYDTLGANRLKEIKNLKSSGANISTFAYEYDPNGQIKTWSQSADAQTPKVYSFQYDAVGQLLNATLRDGSLTGQVLRTYVYGYDQGGNRTSEQIDDLVTTSTHNGVNQLTGQRTSLMSAPLAGPGAEAKKAPKGKPTPLRVSGARPKAARSTASR